jgi:dipeptidase
MMFKPCICFMICICSLGAAVPAEACTTMIVTKGAAADGSTYVTHSNDSIDCDPSLVYVPAKDHAPGSMRPVYPSAIAYGELAEYDCAMTPRLAAAERAPGYAHKGKATKALGAIPEVAHTYAYIDSDYGVVNECGLMLGECTDNARLEILPVHAGQGIFYSSELGRVALERCRTAREAVHLMGRLVDTYGIYGTGETLLVADKDEGWVFEMQPVPSGHGGLWVAQRVPDGEVFAAANQFRIRDISLDDPDQIFNPELPAELQKLGWAAYDATNGRLDWLQSLRGVEDFHPYFALRRVWRALSLAAPSLQLPAYVEGPYAKAYPFAVRPDRLLTLDDLMAIHRDVYEGTEFDMTKGNGAGLFASPARYGGRSNRAIACRISGYTWITQANAALPLPIAWTALAPARESTFVPLAVAALPQGYEEVDRRAYDAAKPWWHYTQVAELVQGRDSVMIGDVRAAAQAQEKAAQAIVQAGRGSDAKTLAARLRAHALQADHDWQDLYGQLLVKYNEGQHTRYADGVKVEEPNFDKY